MSFTGGTARHLFGSRGRPTPPGLDVRSGSLATISIEKPKVRSMSENRAQSVAQAGVIQINGSSDSLKQLFLDNARMWDCLCLMKSDPTIQCEFAIRVIFSLDDFQFLSSSQDGSGMWKQSLGNITSSLEDPQDVEQEKQRLTIENSRLHAVLWVLRDNPNLQVDSTVAAIFRMNDNQVQEKFGSGFNYSPGCLSLLMNVGSKWKPIGVRRSSNPDQTVTHLLRSNRSRSTSSREMRSQVRRLSGVKQLWSWGAKQLNSTSNWKATVSGDREPTGKSMQGNSTILLVSDKLDVKNSDLETSGELESESFDSSLSYSCPLRQEKYYNTNMNQQSFESRSKILSSFNMAKISTTNPSVVNFESFSKHQSPIPLDDFYIQQQKALRQSLQDSKMASYSYSADVRPSRVTFDTEEHGQQETGQSTKQNRETAPKITYSTAPAHIPHRGDPYPLPSHPTPRYFIERHRNTKTEWEHPYKSDLLFCFTSKLHEPNLQAHHTMLGPIDASNKIIKQFNGQRAKGKKRKEGVRD